MPRDELTIYALLCIAALVVYAVIIPAYIEEPDWVSVSPALLPRVCCGLIFVLAAVKLMTGLRMTRQDTVINAGQFLRLGGVVLLLVTATLAMYRFGFWVPVAAMVVALLFIAGLRNPIIIGLYTAALVGSSWYLLDLAGLYIIAPY